ncbi:MAG: abortive infection family protein [Gemmatimonadaceae bacterium]
MNQPHASLARAPLTDAVIVAVAQLVDDAQTDTREPSHSAIGFQIERTSVQEGDPNASGKPVGKAKRVRGTLSWALEHQREAGEELVYQLVTLVRGHGGFREDLPNFVGSEAIANAAAVFRTEGYELAGNGELRPLLLDRLSGKELTQALRAYVRRARQGAEDAALLAGTAKDLLEATAAHVLVERFGTSPTTVNFPTLLGQAFVALGLATTAQPVDPPQQRVDAALYALGCSVNALRNKQGTGHGRPFAPSVTATEARLAVESMGVIADRLLSEL